MSSFPEPVKGRWGMVAQIASLLITGVVIWNATIRPHLMFERPAVIVIHALFYAFLAWFFSAIILAGLWLFLPDKQAGQLLSTTFRTASVAVWFAPACILLSQLSPATLVAALVLVITATRLLYNEWSAGSPPLPPKPVAGPLGLFGFFTIKRPMVTRQLVTGLAAACALQAGVISVWWRHPMLAGAWFVLAAAITTLFAMVSGAVEDSRPPALPRSAMGMALTVLLAAGLTVGGLRVARGRGNADGEPGDPAGANAPPGAVASAKEILKSLFGDEDKPSTGPGAYTPKPPPMAPGIAPDGTFPGVILMPDPRPVARLVAPPPRGLAVGTAPDQPYGIPFDGPYLYYRWPYRRPPPTSILQHGTPAQMSFSTTDHTMLNMEAVQKFDEPVDLSCCRAVRIDIWNADRYPDTVDLDFYCNDRRMGWAPVRSTPDLKREPMVAVAETVEIPVVGGGACSEFKVRFRRRLIHTDKSPRMALERFVLVP
jgi:hypothetical protein